MVRHEEQITLRALIGFTLFLGGALFTCAHAHSPHDVIKSIAVSPGYIKDQTLFISILDELKRSTDGGYTWKNLENGLDNGAVISHVAASSGDPDKYDIFVSTRGDGVYRSSDRGASWHPVSAGLENLNIHNIILSPDYINDQTLVALPHGSGLFISATGGDSWRPIATGVFVATSVEVVKDGGNTRLLAGTDKGEIYLSDNEYNNWSRRGEITGAGSITAISSHPHENNNNVHVTYVGTALNGMYESIDLGKSFKHIEIYPALENTDKAIRITSIETAKNNRGSVDIFVTTWNESAFFSADGGETWTKSSRGLKKNRQADEHKRPHFFGIAIPQEYARHGNAFVAGFSGLFKTDNKGETWTEMETRPARNIEGMAVSPSFSSDRLVALASYDGGAYISTDSGKTWRTRNTGLRSTHLWDIAIASDKRSKPVIFSVSNMSFLTTGEDSAAWSRNEIAASKYWKFVTANFDEGSFVTKLAHRLFDRPDFSFPTQIAVSPEFSADATVFLGTRYKGILKTTDAGSSWTNPWQAEKGWISSLKVSPGFRDDRMVASAARKKGFYLSTDSGEKWLPGNEGLSPLALEYHYLGTSVIEFSPDYAVDNRIYFGTADGLYLTLNQGQSWKKLNIPGKGHKNLIKAIGISPDFATDGTILVSIKGRGLFKSTDKGNSFTEIASDLILSNELFKLIRFSPTYANDQTIFAASPEEAYVSNNTGASWIRLKRPIRYEDAKSNIVYSGKWQIRSNNTFSALDIHTSNTPGARADFYFVGEQVTWFGPRSGEYGLANVYIDGKPAGEVDQFGSAKNSIAPIFTINGLSRGAHVLTIEVIGEKNKNASDHYIAIDALEVI